MTTHDEAPVIGTTRRTTRRWTWGLWSVVVAFAMLAIMAFLPTSYVIQQPGPVYNTLGEATTHDGGEAPLITVDGKETYDTAGSLDLTTVQVVGNRERTPSWFELALAWLDPSRAVVPLDAVFPEGTTTEQRDEQNAVLMDTSQSDATAAALTELGYDVASHLAVAQASDEDSPANGVLEAGDVILTANGEEVSDVDRLRAIIDESQGTPLTLTIRRDDAEQEVSITPVEQTSDGETSWVIGVYLSTVYDFPFDVTIRLDDVGGPSAGMMFALGIIDTLTPGELNGGEDVAGTGEIAADGTVGAIGGIRQKLYGARNAGADYFLAPSSNCDEVIGHVPDGLEVFAVSTLDDSLTALAAISDGDTSGLATCDTVGATPAS